MVLREFTPQNFIMYIHATINLVLAYRLHYGLIWLIVESDIENCTYLIMPAPNFFRPNVKL